MISIHALREEGDGKTGAESIPMLISIHALREEGDPVFHLVRSNHVTISIHALREEGDRSVAFSLSVRSDFYPRPPRGGRPPSGA